VKAILNQDIVAYEFGNIIYHCVSLFHSHANYMLGFV